MIARSWLQPALERPPHLDDRTRLVQVHRPVLVQEINRRRAAIFQARRARFFLRASPRRVVQSQAKRLGNGQNRDRVTWGRRTGMSRLHVTRLMSSSAEPSVSGASINALLFDMMDADAAVRAVYASGSADVDDELRGTTSSDPSEMSLIDKIVDGAVAGRLQDHLPYLNNYADPAFCELYLAFKSEAAGLGIPDALLYLAALRLHVIRTWRGTALMWPLEFAHWLEIHLARERGDDEATQGQFLSEYRSARWTQFMREWNARVRPVLLPVVTKRATAVAQRREMKRRSYSRGLGPCPLLDFAGIEYAEIVDTLPLSPQSTVPALARRLRVTEAHPPAVSAVPPAELAGHMAGMIVTLGMLGAKVASEVRSHALRPVPMPSKAGDMLNDSGVMQKWKALGKDVIEHAFNEFPEGGDDAPQLQVREWERSARIIVGELLEVQSIVSRVFAEAYRASEAQAHDGDVLGEGEEIPMAPELFVLNARIDDFTSHSTSAEIARILDEFGARDLRELQGRLRQQFDTTGSQIRLHNSRLHASRGGPSPSSQRRHVAFVDAWRRPGAWQSAVEQVYAVAASSPTLRSSTFDAFGRSVCSLLVQAHLQGPSMEVELPVFTYARIYNRQNPAWSSYANVAPVRETSGAHVAAIVVVWPGLIDRIDGAQQGRDEVQTMDGNVDGPMPSFEHGEGVVLWKLG